LQQLLPDVLPLVNADGTITFPQITTISEGTATYANDQTTVTVSPTR
jgi:hypothetical protein